MSPQRCAPALAGGEALVDNGPVPRPYFHGRGLACFAHRGGAARWPENSLEAFRGGWQAGCRFIETDLHMTRDGHIVCFHDDELARTTNGRGKVWELSLAELRRLDVGYRFSPDGRGFPYRGRGLTVPTLAELLAIDPQLRANLEIKQVAPAMHRALWRYLDDHGLHDRVLVAGERDALVRAFRNLARGAVATSAGKREIFEFWLAAKAGLEDRLAIEYEALQVPHRFRGLTVVDRRFVAAAHRRGVQVHVWTIDDPAQMRELIGLGVDGIMTDRPQRLVEVARSLGVYGPAAAG